MHANPDQIDWPGLQRGERAALKQAWELHADFVFFVARKFMVSQEATEDVVQEVFIKLATGVGGIRDSGALRGWLAVATRNACIDALRKAQRQIATEPEKLADLPDADNPNPADQMIRAAESDLAGRCLDEISQEPGGEILLLFYREGLPVAEIARRRGEPVGTVTSRLTRMREKLRAKVMALELAKEDVWHE